MSRKIIYVYNPISGGATKAALIKKIETITKAKNCILNFLCTNAEGDYKLLRKRIEHEEITDVIIVGGDGTVNQVTVHFVVAM
jgi:diacylglycerol kinase family enzyme